MQFKQVEAFRTVMICGTVSRAADVLGVTQPAVSRLVAELERSTGLTLFERIKGRLAPTPEAQLLFRDVEASFKGLESLRASAGRIRDFGSGDIRIASLSSMGSTLVPAAIAGFVASHPKVSVTLQVHPSLTVRDLVAAGGFDIGLAADEIDVSGVEHQVFATPRMLCAIPAGHHLAERSVIRAIDLHEESFVALAPEDTVRRAMDADLKSAGSRPRIVVETPYSLTVAALVGRGIGVGLVNPYSLGDLDRSKVILRAFEPALHARTLLLLPPGQQKSGLVRGFIDALITARNRWHLNQDD
ncbi:LysR substrate-binding domain-containing protein [Microvirga sp. RSM25]|uniref:LysR substrate-binding domain-containing protein n=1 Tax=Microvirga sp. RSM25 TaxID=3273802 RepID=UPI00384DA61B